MLNLKTFKHDDWVKIYDGRWSFLTSTHFSDQYTKELVFGGRPFKSQSIIFVAHGRSAGWMHQKDRDILGKHLSGVIAENPKTAKEIAEKLRYQAKDFLKFIDENENTIATKKLYDEFWHRLLIYYHPHISVKYVVDYLHPDLLERYLEDLQEARLAAETVLNRTEDFIVDFVSLIGKKKEYEPRLLLCLTKTELNGYFTTDTLPNKTELEERDTGAVILGDKTSFTFFTGSKIKNVEELVSQTGGLSELKGSVAFPGTIRGTVRIIFDPRQVRVFNRGDILVAGATRPEFLPIMEKAGAFVTDAGGILSHAAITAREMKKPCVIGTKIATKVFKDGDMVEVDADNGIVKKL